MLASTSGMSTLEVQLSRPRVALVLLALVVLVFLRDLAFALLGSSDSPGALVRAVLGWPGEAVLLGVCLAALW